MPCVVPVVPVRPLTSSAHLAAGAASKEQDLGVLFGTVEYRARTEVM
jgi:hypothetical protein